MNPESNPILINLPDELKTDRLTLRAVRIGDGAMINEAVLETIDDLQLWMPWANPTPTVDDTEIWCRKALSEIVVRKSWHLLIFRNDTGGYIGTIGMHNLDWKVPRFELGYWLRRSAWGHGFMSEAVAELTRFLFEEIEARRVEIRMDATNQRSRRVAERLGFELEGALRNDSLSTKGEVRNTLVFSKVTVGG